jgi:predicted aspartyl protease
VNALADTGATYTSIPAAILAGIGVTQIDTVKIELADGRAVRRRLGNALVHLQGKTRATPVIFGMKGDATVVGLVALEACGLTVDTVNRRLVPIEKIHHYRFGLQEQRLPSVEVFVRMGVEK